MKTLTRSIPFTLAVLAGSAFLNVVPVAGMAAPDSKSRSTSQVDAPEKKTRAPKASKPVATPAPPRGSHRPPALAVPRMETRAWMGVATSPIAPVLREHLELPEGFGIQVEYVVEDSPASKAGLKNRDLLTQFDDQLLTTPEHLAILVNARSKGEKVTLTVIRKGAEKTLEITLGEIEGPVQPQWPQSYGSSRPPQSPGQLRPSRPEEARGSGLNEDILNYQDELRRWMERQQPQRFQPSPPQSNPTPPSAARPALPLPGIPNKPDGAKPLPPGRSDQKPPAISVRPGFPVSVFSGTGMIRIDNPEGEVSIEVKDGKHSIKIVNEDGETVYEGNYDPEKGTEGLPKEARKQLETMKLEDLKMLEIPGKGTRTETKTEIKIEIGAEPSPAKGKGSEKGDLL